MVSTAGWVDVAAGRGLARGRGHPRRRCRVPRQARDAVEIVCRRRAAAQILVGLVTLVRGGRAVAVATAVVNGGAVVAWIVTRLSGISGIEGLEQSRRHGSPTPLRCPSARWRSAPLSWRCAVGCMSMHAAPGAARTVGDRRRCRHGRRPLSGTTQHTMLTPSTATATMRRRRRPSPVRTMHQGAHDQASTHGGERRRRPDAGPIDLSGVDGVTPAQQAFAEEPCRRQRRPPSAVGLIGRRRSRRVPRGSGTTTVVTTLCGLGLDRRRRVAQPTYAPESLVYRPQPDGSKVRVCDVHAARLRGAAGRPQLRRRTHAVGTSTTTSASPPTRSPPNSKTRPVPTGRAARRSSRSGTGR